jgi:hypothetical protein
MKILEVLGLRHGLRVVSTTTTIVTKPKPTKVVKIKSKHIPTPGYGLKI